MDNGFKYVCECGAELPPSHEGPCPECGESGKLHKAFKKSAHVSVGVEVHGNLRARHKQKGFSKFKKQIEQGHYNSINPKLRKGVNLERIIDKEKDEYHEVVKNAETGETIREVHEPLSQHTHSNQNWTWCSFFFDRAGRLPSRFWKLLASYSVLILVLTALLYSLALIYSKGEVLAVEASSALGSFTSIFSVVALGLAVAIFLFAFILLFILSFSPEGRRLADKIFGFNKLTKLEKFKNKVDSELAIINKRLDNLENSIGNLELTVKNQKTRRKIMGSKGRKNVKKAKKVKDKKDAQKK